MQRYSLLCLLLLITMQASASDSTPAVPDTTPAASFAETHSLRSALTLQEIRAQLSPRRFTTLAAEVGAKINQLPLRESASFKKGDLLIALDCSLQQAQLNKAKAALNAAEKVFTANSRLAELNSIGQVELLVSEAEVGKNRAEVESIEVQLSKCRIVAPFHGRISELKVRELQFIQAGAPIMEIIDDSALELEFIAPSKWLSWLSIGYRFSVIIDETSRSYPARITRVGAKVDPISQSIKLFAEIDGKFPELITGMSGRVDITPPVSP